MHGGLGLANSLNRKGRKRKTTARFPCGKAREVVTDAKVIALTMPHRRDVPDAVRHDAKAESEIGRMSLRNAITTEEYEAARWFSGVVHRYRSLIEAPNPSPPSNAGILVHAPAGQAYIDDDEAERRTVAYNTAYEALVAGEYGMPHRRALAVKLVVVQDHPCPEGFLPDLRRGLIALAVHRGMLKPQTALDMLGQISHFRNAQ